MTSLFSSHNRTDQPAQTHSLHSNIKSHHRTTTTTTTYKVIVETFKIMPICETCDGESFYDQDGKFYCNNCGTQSQDIQVEVDQEMDFESTNLSQQRHLTLKAAGKNKGRKRKPHNVGKPWVAAEGFQLLLKAQTESLLKMGFDKYLKDVVKEIWFSYLRVTGMAFCDDELATICLQNKLVTGRSERVGMLPLSVKKKRCLVPKSPRLERKIPTSLMFDNIKDEEFYDDDRPDFLKEEDKEHDEEEIYKQNVFGDEFQEQNEREDLDRNVSNDDDEKIEDFCFSVDGLLKDRVSSSSGSDDESELKEGILNDDISVVGSLIINKKTAIASIPMKQPITLCICYLALVWLDEPVLWSDLIRWVKEGHLPYHNADKIFPEEFKFLKDDNYLFNTGRHPKIWKCSRLSHALLRHLQINMMYTKETCKILLFALVNDLSLSESIGELACYLFDMVDMTFSFQMTSKCISVDCYLTAFIAVAVKLVYLLNGEDEYAYTIRAKLLCQLNLSVVQSWTEWVTSTMKKYKLKLYDGIPSCNEDLKHIHDVSVYYDFCAKDVFTNFRRRPTTRMYYVSESHWKSGFNDEAKEKYFKMFKNVADTFHPHLDDICRLPSSFPLSISFLGNNLEELMNLQSSFKTGQCIEREDVKIDTNNVSDPISNENVKDNNDHRGKSYCNTDNNDYIVYTDFSRETWHDSYRFLLKVLSNRIEVEDYIVQLVVLFVEKKIFCEEFKKAFKLISS